MNKSAGRSLLLCALPLLVSCTEFTQPDPAPQVRPLFRVSDSLGSAPGYFLLGTYYEGQGRSEQAAAAYRQAIQIDADAVEARNRLALLLSAQGEHDKAIAELVTAVRARPRVAKYHNNLGYVYYLSKDYAGAINEFRIALALDPRHALASTNLTASCEQLDVLAAHRVVLVGAGTPGQAGSVPCGTHAGDALAGAQQAPSPSLFDRVATMFKQARSFINDVPEVPASAAAARTPTRPVLVRLEIVNANGAAGLAGRVRDALQGDGSPPARLTNLKPFTQRQTVIQFRPHFQQAAHQLSLRFAPHPIRLVAADTAAAVDLKLILGRDIAAGKELIASARLSADPHADATIADGRRTAAKKAGPDLVQR